MTRRVVGTPILRKRRRRSSRGGTSGASSSGQGAGASGSTTTPNEFGGEYYYAEDFGYEDDDAFDDENAFEDFEAEEGELFEQHLVHLKRGKRQRKWLCERERLKSQNCLRKLFNRETTKQGNLGFVKGSSSERFKRMHLQQMFNTHDASNPDRWALSFLRKPSRVVEIVGAKGMIFALSHSGVCAAFCRETNKRLCYLNTHPDEVVRSLFYNKNNDTLITVSVYAYEKFSTLKCKSTPLEYIRRGQPLEGGMALFEEDCLKWPGFVEFDDVNGKVLTYNAQMKMYKVFDLKNYELLYKISAETVSEIKVSPGILLLINDYEGKDHVPLKILSVDDGKCLKEFNHPLVRDRVVDFVEQFDEKLLVKQERENLRITDVCTGKCVEVANTQYMNPSAFIFLYENHLFLTFRESLVEVWNFKGELVTSFEDHLLWHPTCNTNNIYITQEQDLIVSYCKPKQEGEGGQHEKLQASINVSSILTGKCHAKLGLSHDKEELEVITSQNQIQSPSGFRPTTDSALGDVTALYYNEDQHEIYTGNASGRVYVWAN